MGAPLVLGFVLATPSLLPTFAVSAGKEDERARYSCTWYAYSAPYDVCFM